MLKINFYPESDFGDYKEAVEFFKDFWQKDGDKITNKWEEISGFKFWETEINAVVGEFISHSHPLSLRFNIVDEVKKVVLIHELGHRLLIKRIKGRRLKTSEETHKFLYLLLKDVLVELYGEEAFKTAFDFDMKISRKFGRKEYENAWNWALSFKTKEERQNIFKKILEGDLSILE